MSFDCIKVMYKCRAYYHRTYHQNNKKLRVEKVSREQQEKRGEERN